MFFPYKKDMQNDTKIDQSEYKVSIDQPQAGIFIHSLLVNFFSFNFFNNILNLFTFREQNFLTIHGENKFLNVENFGSQKVNLILYT